ncbi:hypothetical protein VNO80_34002 [Phaseolus coccineus]|uniref:Uncharacterized protein n=1 Tax=Phaseolus coccineus TaxID=3886 RepID=A0AAN9L2F4_PHACN
MLASSVSCLNQTKDQLADALTKSLSQQRFSILRSKIGVSNESTILRGRISDKGPRIQSSRRFPYGYLVAKGGSAAWMFPIPAVNPSV